MLRLEYYLDFSLATFGASLTMTAGHQDLSTGNPSHIKADNVDVLSPESRLRQYMDNWTLLDSGRAVGDDISVDDICTVEYVKVSVRAAL